MEEKKKLNTSREVTTHEQKQAATQPEASHQEAASFSEHQHQDTDMHPVHAQYF
jgi:hypothetical protein